MLRLHSTNSAATLVHWIDRWRWLTVHLKVLCIQIKLPHFQMVRHHQLFTTPPSQYSWSILIPIYCPFKQTKIHSDIHLFLDEAQRADCVRHGLDCTWRGLRTFWKWATGTRISSSVRTTSSGGTSSMRSVLEVVGFRHSNRVSSDCTARILYEMISSNLVTTSQRFL